MQWTKHRGTSPRQQPKTIAPVVCKSSPDGGKAPLQEILVLQSMAENMKKAPTRWSMAEWEWEDGVLQSQTKEHLIRAPNVCQIRCLSLRLMLQDNEGPSFTQGQDNPWSPLPHWALEQVSPLIAVSQMVIALRALLTWDWLVSKLDACLSSACLKVGMPDVGLKSFALQEAAQGFELSTDYELLHHGASEVYGEIMALPLP